MLLFDIIYYVIALNIEIQTNDSFKIVINQQLEYVPLENHSVVTFGIDLMKMDPVHVAHVRGILVDDSFYASQITQPTNQFVVSK